MKKKYRQVKGSVKRRLGLSSGNQSSTSLPDLAQQSGSLSPGPQANRRAITPVPNDPQTQLSRSSFLAATSPAPVGPASSQISSSANVAHDDHLALDPDSAPTAGTSSNPAPKNPKLDPREDSATPSSWPGLGLLTKVLDVTAGIVAPFKASELSDLVQVFEIASKQVTGYGDLQTALDALLGDISQHLNGMASPKMTTSMKNLYNGIKTELQTVEQKLTRGTLKRHIEAVEDPDQVLECYRRIGRHLERLMLNANLSIWEIVDRLEAEARLQKLSSAIMAMYNSAESEDVQRRECTPGTREEEIAKLLTWARDTTSEKRMDIFWMNGMAGTGKTTIAYSICTELERSGELGASFFCSRQIPECRNIKLIIPTIAYQLARYSLPFRCALSRVLEADPDVYIRVLKTQFDSLIVRPLAQVKHTLSTDLVVVIDALDECENKNAVGHILDVLLSGNTASELPIRFLVSSRPEPDIYTRMVERLGASQNTRLVLHDLGKERVRQDIKTFLQAELQSIDLTLTQIMGLVDRSGVLFIFASTAARYIKDGLRLKQCETRLNVVLGLDSASAHGKNRDIDRLYARIIATAFDGDYLEEADRTLLKTALDTAMCVQEPMSVNALASLMDVTDIQRVDSLLRLLLSVLNISEVTGLVTTLHASFPDFMLDHQRSAAFHCNPVSTHSRISQACLRVIQPNVPQFNVCRLASSHLRDADTPDLEERVAQLISQQLDYSCRHWIGHFKLAGAQERAGEWLHGLLSESLLLWMEVLNLKKNMHLGPGILHQAEEWARTNCYPKETIELAHDSWRFATTFAGHVISESTPHIYVSMLPFWPDYTPVSHYYKQRMMGAIRPQGTGMSRRQLALLATWRFSAEIRRVCLSPDGSLIAYSLSSSVYIMDGTTGRSVLTPFNHTEDVGDLVFSVDGTLLASSSDDQTLKVWSTSTGKLTSGPLRGHTDWVTSVCFTPDSKRVVSGSRDRTIRIWSVESEQAVVGPLHGHQGSVWSVSISSDGTRIASGSDDRTIRVWSAESGELLLGPLEGHTGTIWSVCFSPDNTRLVSASKDCTVRIWGTLLGHTHVDILEGHTASVESAVFSPDGKQLVSGSLDDTVRLWDVQGTPQLARVFTGHTQPVMCVRFSSDGARIVSSSGDSTIRVWDARSQGPADSPLEGHTEAVSSVAFSHGGSRIVSGSNDGTIYVWDGRSGQVAVGPMKGHSDWVYSVCVSPDGSRIASGSKDKAVQLWDADSGKALGKPLTGHSGQVLSVCFSPDGTLLASSSEDKATRLWNAESGEPVGSPFEAHTSYVLSVFFSPDSLRLVSGSGDETILVWDVSTGKPELPPLRGHTDAVSAVCVSPDGTRIASGSGDTTVRLWDANNGQSVIGPLLGHTAIVRSVCFSPNSSYVISGSDDKTIRLWDARSGQAVGSPLVGHTAWVRSVAFSSDGRQIVSGSDDCSIRVWDIADLVQPQKPKDDINKDSEPSHAHQSWVLQDDGWVVDPQSRLLAWVPPDLHTSLMNPRNPLLISTKGSVQLDLESAKIGESWVECYEPAS